MPGRLYIFSAPSGAGKSTIIDSLKERMDSINYSVSHTSRKPRGNEKNGIHYHFVDKDTFSKMIQAKAFVEWAEVYKNFYGTSFSSLEEQTVQGCDVLLDLDHQGAKKIKKKIENSVLIYILPPSLDVLENRLKKRATDDEKIMEMRLNRALKDIENCLWYDYIIINNDLEKAIETAHSIIISTDCKTKNQTQKIKELFGVFADSV